MKKDFTKQLKKSWKGVLLFTLVVMSLAVVASVIQPMDYSSKVQALIIQNQKTDVDSYVAAKSAEKVGKNLSAVIGTTSFLDLVVQENMVDLSDITALPEKEKREVWQDKVSAGVIPETGIIEIEAFDPDPNHSAQIATAVAAAMVKNADEYHGGGDTIEVKVVNKALTSDYPVRPNLLMNVLLAFTLGMVTSLIYVFLKDDVREILGKKKGKLGKIEEAIDDYLEKPSSSKNTESEQYVMSEREEPEYNVLDPSKYAK